MVDLPERERPEQTPSEDPDRPEPEYNIPEEDTPLETDTQGETDLPQPAGPGVS